MERSTSVSFNLSEGRSAPHSPDYQQYVQTSLQLPMILQNGVAHLILNMVSQAHAYAFRDVRLTADIKTERV